MAEQSRGWPCWQEGCHMVVSAGQPNCPLNLLGKGKEAHGSDLVTMPQGRGKGPGEGSLFP